MLSDLGLRHDLNVVLQEVLLESAALQCVPNMSSNGVRWVLIRAARLSVGMRMEVRLTLSLQGAE